MTYIELINAFNRWCETNYLPGSAQLLWFRLIDRFNTAGWCEWISVDKLKLMALIDVKREASFISLRNKLIDAGLFEYQKGKKGSPSRYKICTVNFESTNSSTNRSTNRSEKRSTNSSKKRSRNRRHI